VPPRSQPKAPVSGGWLALLVLCLGELMIVLDVTIVGVALPSIRADLGSRKHRWRGLSTRT